MIEKYNSGQLELKAGCNAEQSLEDGMNGELGKIRDKAGDMLKKTLPRLPSLKIRKPRDH